MPRRSSCTGRILDKTRHYVPGPSGLWEIDVYHDVLEGIIIAEIELDSETAHVHVSDWIAGDPRYSKTNMLDTSSRAPREIAARSPCEILAGG